VTRVSSRGQAARLREIAKAGAGTPPRKPRQCPACLQPETWHVPRGGGQAVSSLAANGLCADRIACTGRQPQLFPEESQ
jgi:hypothetical protein